MPDRAKFAQMVERRMAQFDSVLRMIEPLSRNYQHEPQDAAEMILYMRQGIDKLESLFRSGGKIGGFRLKNPTPTPDLLSTEDPEPKTTKSHIRKVQ